MPKIFFQESNGQVSAVEASVGRTLMQAAKDNGVDGILADCGGHCSCATCHAYIDPAFAGSTGEAGDEERDMLEWAFDVAPTSRLICQIIVNEAMEGLTVRLPQQQK